MKTPSSGYKLIFLFIALLTFSLTITAEENTIELDDKRELFIDDFLIESMSGVKLKLHHPIAREIAIKHDELWEGNISGYHTIFTTDDGLYHMYYRGAHFDFSTNEQSHPQFVCYAWSTDGIRWTKPELGLIEFNGSNKNNIIWKGIGAHNFAPFYDKNPNAQPDAQFKAFGSGDKGLYAFKSPDGIRWSFLQNKPVMTDGAFDSQNLAFWDSMHKNYRSYYRDFNAGIRDIKTATSQNFINWSSHEWLQYSGGKNNHLYTNQIIPYYRAPHIFLGFPKRFMPKRNVVEHPINGISDGILITSRDGVNFTRWGEALIRPGLQDSRWISRNNITSWGIVETPSMLNKDIQNLSIYSSEGYYEGDYNQLRRFTTRIDGFVSINSPLEIGEFTTKPLTFKGSRLSLNMSTSAAGLIKIEIQSSEGEPLTGFRLENCDPIYGDSINRIVRWNNESEIGELAGKSIKLRIVMKDADIYSLKFIR